MISGFIPNWSSDVEVLSRTVARVYVKDKYLLYLLNGDVFVDFDGGIPEQFTSVCLRIDKQYDASHFNSGALSRDYSGGALASEVRLALTDKWLFDDLSKAYILYVRVGYDATLDEFTYKPLTREEALRVVRLENTVLRVSLSVAHKLLSGIFLLGHNFSAFFERVTGKGEVKSISYAQALKMVSNDDYRTNKTLYGNKVEEEAYAGLCYKHFAPLARNMKSVRGKLSSSTALSYFSSMGFGLKA